MVISSYFESIITVSSMRKILLIIVHFTHSNIHVLSSPLFSKAHIWLSNSTFASQLFSCLCLIMKLYTKFYLLKFPRATAKMKPGPSYSSTLPRT